MRCAYNPFDSCASAQILIKQEVFSQSNSKKDAKKSAAYKMLKYVLSGGER